MSWAPYILKVGEPFPHHLPMGAGNGLYPLMLPDGSVYLVGMFDRLEKGDTRVWRKAVEIGVTVVEDIPFVVLEFPKAFSLDGYLNVMGIDDEDFRPFVEGSQANTATLILVEGREKTVRAIRMVGLRHDMMDALWRGCEAERGRYGDAVDVNREWTRVLRRYTTEDLMNKARGEGLTMSFKR